MFLFSNNLRVLSSLVPNGNLNRVMEGKCVSGHVENILLDTTDKTHSQSKSELERHHKKCLQKYKDGQFHIIFIQHFDGF